MKAHFMFFSCRTRNNRDVRLLVLEDDVALGEIIRRGLNEEGFVTDWVRSIANAQALVDSATFDVLIVDLGLPDGDGADWCQLLRKAGRTEPILMLTARATLGDKVRGLDSGADDYLTKPFDFPELYARVRALLRRPTSVLPSVLTFEDIKLDPSTHQVSRGSFVIPLTNKEFAILELLLRNLGSVVTREALFEGAWDQFYDGVSNVIDVNIASLRKKLESTGVGSPIETVRGIGYSIGATP